MHLCLNKAVGVQHQNEQCQRTKALFDLDLFSWSAVTQGGK